MSDYVLLTGATGLLGLYLVRDLLLAGQRLALLLRPSKKQTCRERLEQILQFWEERSRCVLPRPVCIEGDVTETALGLSPADQRWIATNCGRLLHNAASLTFVGSDRQGEPWRTNLQGTENVLALRRRLRIPHLHYVSTAYTCGLREGVVREDELDMGQPFRNDYEHSKFVAEQLVRKAAGEACVTIYRPVVILGDSQSGYTSTYHGGYLYLRLMSVVLRREQPEADGRIHAPVRLNLTGEELRNAVPVDWVSRVLVHLFCTPAAHGRTFHLASDDRIVSREFVEHGLSYFNAYGVQFCRSPQPYTDRISAIDTVAHENMQVYSEYDHTDPIFDTSNLKQFAGQLPAPVVDREMVHRFIRFGEEDNWGKRRPHKIRVDTWAEDMLTRQFGPCGELRVPENDPGAKTELLGLDLVGPGGGQWHCVFQGDALRGFDRGLPNGCGTMLRLPAADFLEHVESSRSDTDVRLRQAVPTGQLAVAQRLLRALSGRLAPIAGSSDDS